ncbi:helix-turn-helix domain-containing protein [Exiguobacterium sp. AM39-5BH]|uniref:helix-turn-helix domain-containing protein n=1 Tax=Exiguobacterium sp. AM39-5BH TaxID=2292355 RepID=UPI001F2CE4E0|nr:helix-turn-helix domain-containing protein [Exiguobacterium sp. AM39-5BH]
MITLLKAYKFRLYPTKPQQESFIKTFGCVRFVYNKMLEERIRLYEESKLNPDAKQKRSRTSARTFFISCRNKSLTRTKSSSWRH